MAKGRKNSHEIIRSFYLGGGNNISTQKRRLYYRSGAFMDRRIKRPVPNKELIISK